MVILQTKISRIAETGIRYMGQYLVEANVTIETLQILNRGRARVRDFLSNASA